MGPQFYIREPTTASSKDQTRKCHCSRNATYDHIPTQHRRHQFTSQRPRGSPRMDTASQRNTRPIPGNHSIHPSNTICNTNAMSSQLAQKATKLLLRPWSSIRPTLGRSNARSNPTSLGRHLQSRISTLSGNLEIALITTIGPTSRKLQYISNPLHIRISQSPTPQRTKLYSPRPPLRRKKLQSHYTLQQTPYLINIPSPNIRNKRQFIPLKLLMV